MADSLFKHFGEQDSNQHGGRLFWHGNLSNGNIPFRGPYAPTITNDELENQVGINFDFKCEVFDLSDHEQHNRYRWVMDRVVNRWFVLHKCIHEMVAANKTVIVYLEWSQRYGELSPSAKAAKIQGYTYVPPQSESVTLPLNPLAS